MKKITISYPLTSDEIKQWGHPQAMAIGFFDGVHLGHQNLIRRAVDYAQKAGIPATVMTFHPHPKEVLGKPATRAQYVTPLDDKIEKMVRLGVDRVYVVRFDEAFAGVSAESFVHNMLFALRVEHAVVGFDFTFGHQAVGDVDALRRLGQGRMTVDVVPSFPLDDKKISSSTIRAFLQEGKIHEVNRLLGCSYRMTGTVVPGEQRGRKLGFPTANLDLTAPYIVPRNGIYAVRVQRLETWYNGVMSIGLKPTFHDNMAVPAVEVHIFDFDEMIYGEQLRVEVVEYIRSERRFPSVDALIAEIARDSEKSKIILRHWQK